MRFNFIVVLLLIVLIGQFYACKKDRFLATAGSDLVFELDTLRFDTVFTDMGSATRRFKVYNPHNQKINISNIQLAGGAASDFHLNIDGKNVYEFDNLELPAKDSIYIFANVRIDPANGDAIRMDSILFETNGSQQKVWLEAFGWNAEYHGQRGYQTTITDSLMTLNPNIPHIFLGYFVVDSNSVLTIPAGTEVFMFGGPSTRPGDRAWIIIGENASIKVNVGGDLNNPVEFKTHRLEEDYQELPFQHSGIYLSANSVDNQVHGCIIRNAVDGIILEGPSVNANPKLELKKSMIYNVDRSCILAFESKIEAENTVLSNSNQYNFIAIQGGEYDFRHCTMVNFGTNPFVGRNEPVLSLRDFYLDQSTEPATLYTGNLNANFENCIIYGTRNEEVEVLSAEQELVDFNYDFSHCFMKLDTFSTNLDACIINQEPYFEDLDNYLYRPDSAISLLIGNASTSTVFDDIESNSRSNQTIGAYEWIP